MFKKVPRPKIKRKKKAKGHSLAQAWATVKVQKTPKWMEEDEIPMRHMPSGRALKHVCTCKVAPTKYCWVCKRYADPEANKPVGDSKVLWGDLFNGKDVRPDLWGDMRSDHVEIDEGSDAEPSNYFGDAL